MSTVTVEHALQLTRGLLQGGQWTEAESICQQVLAAFPGQPEACHLCALAAAQTGRRELALELLQRSIAGNPAEASTHAHLGELLATSGRSEEAVTCYERALARLPGDADVMRNLGVALRQLHRHEEARGWFERAVACQPDFVLAHHSLGLLLVHLGKGDEALGAFERTVQLGPEFVPGLKNLAAMLVARRRTAEARPLLERALALDPNDADTHNNYGTLVGERSETETALRHFARAVELRPTNHVALDNLGSTLRKVGRNQEARECLERAVALQPGYASAWNNLGSLYRHLGRYDEGMECNRKAVAADPTSAVFHSDLVLATYYHPGSGTQGVRAELERWNARHIAPLAGRRQPHTNDRNPERPLRVGYVSSDFCVHVTSSFTVALLEAQRSERVETHGYASVPKPDEVTRRLRRAADAWHDVLALSDAEMAEQVRADRIDILVDLSMHTARSRLVAFGYKPAPVQVTWLAFAGSTGVESMDYRLTDWQMDPADADESWSVELPVRLPDVWCCYKAPGETPPVAPLPAMRNGFVTFGSLNNFVKVNAPTLRRWALALRAVPRSRLLMLAEEEEARAWTLSVLGAEGIDAERVEFVGRQDYQGYLHTFDRIDVGLDPLPFNGMTTTCDGLWMGVPVLSLPGEMPASRAGLSLMHVVGLGAWVARDEEEYARKAVELTANPAKLWRLRTGLRRRMEASALCDAGRFARNVEAAYRGMWRRWCEG